MDKYVKEAEKEEEEKKKFKPRKEYALLDIYRSFRDDVFGVSKSFSGFSAAEAHRSVFSETDAEIYEMLVNARVFTNNRIKTALATGLFISDKDAAYIYDELKRRVTLLNWKPPFSVN